MIFIIFYYYFIIFYFYNNNNKNEIKNEIKEKNYINVSLSQPLFCYFHLVLNLEDRTMCHRSQQNIIAQSMIVDSMIIIKIK